MVYEDWSHELQYRINSHPGAGYTCQLPVSWLPGMALDFRDIRFSDSTGYPLQYFIYSYVTGASAYVRFKLTASTQVRLHYGNGAAVSESNGVGLFTFFDDFAGTALDTGATGWTPYAAPTVSNGIMQVTGSNYIKSKTRWGIPVVFECRANMQSTSNTIQIRLDDDAGYIEMFNLNDYTTGLYAVNTYNWSSSGVNIGTSSVPAYHIYRINRISGSSTIFYIDDAQVATRSSTGTANQFINFSVGSGTLLVDWAIIRPYLATEPIAVLVSSRSPAALVRIVPALGNSQYRDAAASVAISKLHTSWGTSLDRFANVKVDVVKNYGVKGYPYYASVACSVPISKLGTSQTIAQNRPSSMSVQISELATSRIYGQYRPASFSVPIVELDDSRVLHSERPALVFLSPEMYAAGQSSLARSSWSLVPIPALSGVRSPLLFSRDASAEVDTVVQSESRELASVRETAVGFQKVYLADGYVLGSTRQCLCTVPAPAEHTGTLSVLYRPADCSVNTVQAAGIPALTVLRETGLLVMPVQSTEQRVYAQFREVYSEVAYPGIMGVALFGMLRFANMTADLVESAADKQTIGLARETGVEVLSPGIFVGRQADSIRDSNVAVLVSIPMLASDRTLQSQREAAASVQAVDLIAGEWLPITAPFEILLDKGAYTLVLEKDVYAAVLRDGEGMYEITQFDTETFNGTLNDTDPFTGLLRPIPLSGRTVKAILSGGAPHTTVIKDCTVLGDGLVSFSLDSTDTAVPGLYRAGYLVTGTGFRKELPEKREDVQEILLNDALYTG